MIYTDSQYLCPTSRSARWLIQSGVVQDDNVYTYRLLYAPSMAQGSARFLYWLDWCHPLQLKPCLNATRTSPGVGHGSDVPLVWWANKLNATDVALAQHFADFWQNFAQSGDPNGDTDRARALDVAPLPKWPRYKEDESTLLLGVQSQVQSQVEGARCEFWDRLHPLH